MAKVAVEKVNSGAQSPPLTRRLEDKTEQIRERAYDLFLHRGFDGSPLDDWLRAERDLFLTPQSELIEKDGKYEINIAAPGFQADETTVTATKDAVVVSAESKHRHEERDANIHFCEFGSKSLYRRMELPEKINVDQVTANLDNGILRIQAEKAAGAGHRVRA